MDQIFKSLIMLLIPFNGFSQNNADSLKANFSLLKPIPRSLMRGFETDRPDITESAYTIDAGHFQLETDLFKTDITNFNNIKTIDNYYTFLNLKLGLTHNIDVQLVVSPFVNSKIKIENSVTNTSGFGNVTLRIKKNLWGNNGGKSALAIIPFINFPKQSQKLSGGIILPFAIKLPKDWGLGSQLQTDLIPNNSSNAYHFNFLASVTLTHPLVKKTNFFVESFVIQETKLNLFEYYFNGGLIYEATKNLKVDTGFNYGIKSISNKTYFIGLSFRY